MTRIAVVIVQMRAVDLMPGDIVRRTGGDPAWREVRELSRPEWIAKSHTQVCFVGERVHQALLYELYDVQLASPFEE